MYDVKPRDRNTMFVVDKVGSTDTCDDASKPAARRFYYGKPHGAAPAGNMALELNSAEDIIDPFRRLSTGQANKVLQS